MKKMNHSKRNLLVMISMVLCMFMTSCATTLYVDVTRPAELDMNGAASISILPIRPSSYHGIYKVGRGVRLNLREFFFVFNDADQDEQKACNRLKSKIEEGLSNSPYLKIVASDAVMSYLDGRRDENPADAYLTGEVLEFDWEDKYSESKRKLPELKEDEDYTEPKLASNEYISGDYIITEEWTRYVTMEIRYQIVDGKTDEIISFKTVKLSENSWAKGSKYDLPSAYSLIESDIDRTAKDILREIQPYSVTKAIKLLPYSSKHKTMAYANDLAKDGFIDKSYEKFMEIYQSEGIFEAGYNAAMLLEAQAEYEEAYAIMTELSEKYDDKKIISALKDIEAEMSSLDRLNQQNSERGM